ncbi:Cation/calcium exchanger 2 [Euphorbia peplus]|nr:Cation/calcium exchanger 2 [Euphorbia peplus]
MGILVSSSESKRYKLFLNISFLTVACVFLIIQLSSPKFLLLSSSRPIETSEEACSELQKSIGGFKAKCHHLKSHNPCVSEGYIDYLYLFYCNFGSFPILGYVVLFLWLLVLFYLLGNTAAEYFCSSLEKLSGLLKLSPTISGVTLLSLGNGAPDVFASLVSFMGGNGRSDVGFNTVLGGASFTPCIVVGIICILVKNKQIEVSKRAFVRDVCFLLVVLAFLGFILIHGKINLPGAMGFLCLYIFYVILVYSSEVKVTGRDHNASCETDLSIPILSKMEKGERNFIVKEEVKEEEKEFSDESSCLCCPLSSRWSLLIFILEFPLYLPRRLTIPVICEKKWSKPIAVASVTLAPLLLFAVSKPDSTFKNTLIFYGVGLLVGLILGVIAYATTEKSNPPKKCIFPWIAGGFLMSVLWSYIIAQELVALLVSLGYIFNLSPSILGLTVLAWGNSLGDLITNLTMALKGGSEGAQVAISGCYAGPIFNILFGLGLSLVSSTWHNFPSSVVIEKDPYLLETLLFLVAGLIWALVILPSRKMKLDGVLGGGLIGIYLVAVSVRLIQTLGSLQFEGIYFH